MEELTDNGAGNTKGDIGENFVGSLGKRVGEEILGMFCKLGIFFDGNDVGSNFEEFPGDDAAARTDFENGVRRRNGRASD